jgi:hypothetical protein
VIHHLYAITRPGTALPQLTGIEDREVTPVACGRLLAAVSQHREVPRRDRDTALRHATVVEELVAVIDALPVRFGSEHRDAATLAEHLRRDEERLSAALDAVGGCVEFVVRGAGTRPSRVGDDAESWRTASARGAGRTYLEARLEQERAEARLAAKSVAHLEAASASLRDVALAVAERDGPHGPERCFLVRRASAEAFSTVADRVVAEEDLVLGGPWAPYTFAAAAAVS